MTLRMFKKANTKQKKKHTRSRHKFKPQLITRQINDVVRITTSYLEMKDLIHVSTICRESYSLYSKPLAVKKLLQAVIDGNLINAEKIISSNPTLLLERGTVKDYAGRTHINRTAYQLALGACDFNVVDLHGNIVVDGMAEMIEKYFQQLPGKSIQEINQIIQNQHMGQFPENYDEIEKEKIIEDSKNLHRMFEVLKVAPEKDAQTILYLEEDILRIIRTEKSERACELHKRSQSIIKANSIDNFQNAFSDLTNYLVEHSIMRADVNWSLFKALYQFRNYLEPKTSHTIGYHFNHSMFVEAIQLYEQQFVCNYHHWEASTNMFYCQKVLGYIERFVSVQDAQNMAHGICQLLRNGEKSKRSLKFHDGGIYFPLDDLKFSRELGYLRTVTPIGWTLHTIVQTDEGAANWAIFKTYVKQKQQDRNLRKHRASTRETLVPNKYD